MNTFANAVINQEARTENGMKARKGTGSALTDFFFKAGAMRGQDIIPVFVAAYAEDKELALRITAWLRDVREGAGERELFRQILRYLEVNDPVSAKRLLSTIPLLGRWDDVFTFTTEELKKEAFGLVEFALFQGNGLTAKWTPRKGKLAAELRKFMGMSPKAYRNVLVGLTKVVEQQMCANDWENIDHSKVPSLAAARYKKAFERHSVNYTKYVEKLASGDESVKVNASAVYPYDVLKGVTHFYNMEQLSKTARDHIVVQWNSLPNYVGDSNILPMVDVSGSMEIGVPGNTNLNVLCIALSLGLYLAEKNTGKFKNTFLTFSGNPELLNLKGDILQKCEQMYKSTWGMSTDICLAVDKVLSVALQGNVPDSEMPKMLLILSDMQFDSCAEMDASAMEMITCKYSQAGYTLPKIVFWNLATRSNVPVTCTEQGVALVSGFSPSILKSILSADTSKFDPYNIMLETIMKERYDI